MKCNKIFIKNVGKLLKVNSVPFLLGDPGIGKSSMIRDIANDMDCDFYSVSMNQLADKSDLTGCRSIKEMMDTPEGKRDVWKQIFFPHATLMDAIASANKTPNKLVILFLDEVNRTTSDILTAAMSFTTDRRVGTEYFPPNIRFILAGNDRGAIQPVDEAFRTRCVLLHVEPDTDTFLNLPSMKNLNGFIKTVLTMHKTENIIFGRKLSAVGEGSIDEDDDDDSGARMLDIMEDSEEFNQLTTPRTIEFLSNFLNASDDNDLFEMLNDATVDADGKPSNALKDFIVAHTGETQFTFYLLDVIAQHLASAGTANSAANTIRVTKPHAYDDMKNCKDVQALTDYIDGMSTSDRSACLTYALYEKEQNKFYVEMLAPTITKLEMNDMQTLMGLALSHKLDPENLQALTDTNTPIALGLEQIISFNNG